MHGFDALSTNLIVCCMGFIVLMILDCVLHGFIVLLIFDSVLHGLYSFVDI